MQITKLLMLIFLFTFATQVCICMANDDQYRNPYLLGGILSHRTMEEFHFGARMGSYKPDLDELDAILAQFGVDELEASTMYNVFARFKDSPQLSYLVELGYWGIDVSDLEAAVPIDVEATFTQASISFLYYPELIQKYVPLYLGIGGGVAHMDLSGDTLALLREVVTEREDTGLSGNVVVGLEYMIMERLMVNVQANHIFKKFSVDKEDELKFTFDGTVVSIGVSGRL